MLESNQLNLSAVGKLSALERILVATVRTLKLSPAFREVRCGRLEKAHQTTVLDRRVVNSKLRSSYLGVHRGMLAPLRSHVMYDGVQALGGYGV
jgi:hypothetical protein